MKRSSKSREQIAEEMSAMLGVKITARMITSYTSESKELHRWPAEFDLAFCEVTGNYALLADRVKRAGFRLVGPNEERLLEIGRAVVQKARAEKVLAEVRL
jgi:hypothetical protein